VLELHKNRPAARAGRRHVVRFGASLWFVMAPLGPTPTCCRTSWILINLHMIGRAGSRAPPQMRPGL
jgi:hypothetical protein